MVNVETEAPSTRGKDAIRVVEEVPPFAFVLVKLASRCNINCTYCYWFRDAEVYNKPAVLTIEAGSRCTDLALAITLGVTSAEGSPLQVFAGPGSAAMQQLPWSFVPT